MLIGWYPGGEEGARPAVGGDLGAGLVKDAGRFEGAASTAFNGVADFGDGRSSSVLFLDSQRGSRVRHSGGVSSLLARVRIPSASWARMSAK